MNKNQTVGGSTLTNKSKQQHRESLKTALSGGDNPAEGNAEPADVQAPAADPSSGNDSHEPLKKERPQASQPPAGPQDTQGGQADNFEQDEKKVDKQPNLSDNTDDQQSQSAEDGDVDAEVDDFTDYEHMFTNQFKNDGRRATKSFVEAQRKWATGQQELEEAKQNLNFLGKVLEANPQIAQQIEAAAKGYTPNNDGNAQSPAEPVNRTTAHQTSDNPVNTQSNPQQTAISEQELANTGFLDLSRKSQVTPEEWRAEVLDAKLNYTSSDHYIQTQAQKVYQAQQQLAQQDQQTQKAAQQRQQIKTENTNRYNSGYDRAVKELGLNFVDNPDMLQQVHTRMKGYRDAENPQLWHKNAFYLAAKEYLEEGGQQQTSAQLPTPNRQVQKPLTSGFNRNKAGEQPPVQKKTDDQDIGSRIDQAHKSKHAKSINRRVTVFRNAQQRR